MTAVSFSHHQTRFAWIGLSFLFSMQFSLIGSYTIDDLLISVGDAGLAETYQGYIDYSVSITNRSQTIDHEVTVFLPAQTYYSGGDCIQRISRSAVIGAGATVSLLLFQPPLEMHGNGLGVIIDGVTQKETVPLTFANHSGYYGRSTACILLSRNVRLDDFQAGIELFNSSGAPGGTVFKSGIPRGRPGGGPFFGGTLPSEIVAVKSEQASSVWSTNQLGYSRYSAIVLTAQELEQMSPSIRSALLGYVQCGGNLLVLGWWNCPADWRGPEYELGPFRINQLHFGCCVDRANADLSSWAQTDWQTLFDLIRNSHTGLGGRMDVTEANERFPVTDNLTIPIRGLFVLVFIFAVLLGPVNLLVLWTRKKQIWMLWTVPVISLAASLSVFLFAFLAEGWQGYQRRESITILDESQHRATTLGIDAYYCPLTPRDGLHYSMETEVTPWGIESWQGGRSRTMDWTGDQHLQSGWVAARIPAHFLLRKNQLRRERLEIHKEQDTVFVLNGIGADIERMWYADEEGKIYVLENLAAGARQAAKPLEGQTIQPAKTYQWNGLAPAMIADLLNQPEFYLVEDSYILEIKQNVFVEEALKSIKEKRERAVIFGLRKGAVDAGSSGSPETVF